MQVILLQRIEKLGKLGEVVNVRPGYARNFLLPKKVALRATKENIVHFEKEKAALETLNLKHKEEAELLAKRLAGSMVVLIRQASESGQLYGSVTARDIADGLKQEHVTKNHVKIEAPIKTIGIHAVRVLLHPEVSLTVGVNVAMSEDEAKAQAKAIERNEGTSEESKDS
jgi:large subunit ribosomal protein L9